MPRAKRAGDAPATLSTAALATMLGVSPQQVRQYAADGMPGEKAGRVWRFDPAACRAWIKRSKLTQQGGPRPGAGRPKRGAQQTPTKKPAATPKSKAGKGKAARTAPPDPPTPPPVPDAVIDTARASLEQLLRALPADATAADARTLKDLLNASLAQLDVRKRQGELVEVADLRVALARAFTSAERYLDTSRRPTALSIAEDLGLPHDQVAAIEERIAARDDEFRRRMRQGSQVEEIEA